MSRQDRATADRNTRTLRELVKRLENKLCADCKRNDPRWASWNIGVFLCIRCSGIHRGMGTHISKVKSVDLDMWTPEQMESIQRWGNHRANLYWEAHLKPGHIPPEHKMESFIRSKYESRRWAKEGPPPPDPSVLESSLVADAPPPLPPQDQPAVASVEKSHLSRSSVSSPHASRFTTQQPQARQLLSTNFSKSAPTQPPARPATQSPPSDFVPALQDDIFTLDFHAPPPVIPSNTAPEQPKKDVKQDILSLFPNTVSAHNPMNNSGSSLWNVSSEVQQPAQTSMIGSTGVGAWGASSEWSASTPIIPAQPNVWNTSTNITAQQNNSLFNTSNVWGRASTAPNIESQKKDDVFGDIWGSFK